MDNIELIKIINNVIPPGEKIDIERRVKVFSGITKLLSKFLGDQFSSKEHDMRLIKTVVENTIQIRSCPFGKNKDILLRMVLTQELEDYVERQLELQFNAKEVA